MEANAAQRILSIRDARASDLPRIVEMGRNFRRDSSYAKYLSENPKRMTELAEMLIAQNGLIVYERREQIVGMLGFIVYPHFISGEIVAGEVFWWVEPEHRGQGLQLYHEMERRARAAGAKLVQMIAPTPAVARIYERLGHEFVESTYQKTL